jgi:hypothetical protein
MRFGLCDMVIIVVSAARIQASYNSSSISILTALVLSSSRAKRGLW